MIGYAFFLLVSVGYGIWSPREPMWYPRLDVCEAARQGAEEMGAHTTDCERVTR